MVSVCRLFYGHSIRVTVPPSRGRAGVAASLGQGLLAGMNADEAVEASSCVEERQFKRHASPPQAPFRRTFLRLPCRTLIRARLRLRSSSSSWCCCAAKVVSSSLPVFAFAGRCLTVFAGGMLMERRCGAAC